MSGYCFMDALVILSLCSNIFSSATQNEDPMFYGVCYQLNATEISTIPRMVLSTNAPISFHNYGFQTSANAFPINCVWFTSNHDAQSLTRMDIEKAEESFSSSSNVQYAHGNEVSSIYCNNQIIIIQTSNVPSKHLCSDACGSEYPQSCLQFMASPRNVPLLYRGESDVTPLVPSMFGISGICISFVIVCVAIYCFGVRYTRWTQEKSGNETEKVIGDVLEEIAKFTIGDDDEGFYDEWNAYGDSDRSESSHSIEEALGRTILRVVSNQNSPEISQAALASAYISESESESDEEQLREDLLAAKETLYAVSHGTRNPYSNLEPIEEQIVERKVNLYHNGGTPKKSPLLDSEWNEPKLLSSDASNSALP